jgi:protein-disulfide isomerase
LVTLVATGCSSPETRSTGKTEFEEPDVFAEIDGQPITRSEVEEAAGESLAAMDFQYRSQRHQLLDNTLRTLVRERLIEEEASARGMSAEQLLQSEMSNIEVTEEEVNRWYEQNRGRIGGRPFDQISTQIRQYLIKQKQERVVDELTNMGAERKKVVYYLEPIRVEVDAQDSPSNGPADAPVTLVEFSDFECGFCGRLVQTLEEVKESYGDQVRFVFRHFPLNMHPNAQKAAEASLCANDQGKFWPMHDLLFKEQAELGVVALKDKASRLGLDRGDFDACLDSGRYAEKVQNDMSDGTSVGITGTPAIFINGIPVPGGAVPFETIAKVIDDELARAGSR